MLTVSKNDIKLTRGDTAYLNISISDSISDEGYTIQPTDTLRLTVKRNIKDTDFAFQKVITGTDTFHIEPTDTNSLDWGKHIYDVELTTENGDIFTVIEPSKFEILQEVTTHE